MCRQLPVPAAASPSSWVSKLGKAGCAAEGSTGAVRAVLVGFPRGLCLRCLDGAGGVPTVPPCRKCWVDAAGSGSMHHTAVVSEVGSV